MAHVCKDLKLTYRSLPPPKSLCVLIRGQVIGIEGDFFRLQDAQDVFYTTGDQQVGIARQGWQIYMNLDAGAEQAAMLLLSERLGWGERPWLSTSRSVSLN